MHDASMSCLAAHKLISGILQREVIRFFRLPSYWFQVTFTQTIHHEEPILSILYPYLEMSKIATALVEYIKQSANNSDFCFAFRQAVCRVGRLCFCFRNGIKYVDILSFIKIYASIFFFAFGFRSSKCFPLKF